MTGTAPALPQPPKPPNDEPKDSARAIDPSPGATPTPQPEQRPKSAIPPPKGPIKSDQPGKFGVGAQVSAVVLGFEPSILYDISRSFTIRGLFNIGPGYSE